MIEHNYKINDWLIETKLGQISRKSNVIQLEPQVMKVLCCLAEHGGDVVTKRFLTESLWQSSYVSDAALARCISQIRAALGDSRKDPKYVQTIPKVGYRLIANVQWTCRNKFFTKLSEFSGPVTTVAAVSVIAATVLSFAAVSQPSDSRSLAFAPVTVRSDQEHLEDSLSAISARVLEEQIRIGLTDVGDHIVVYDESLRSNSAADGIGESYVNRLVGTVNETNRDVSFQFELVNNRTGERVWSANYSSLVTDVFSVSSEVVKNVAYEMDTKLSPEVIRELSRPPTRDVLAHNAYQRAKKHFDRFTYADVKNAITLHEEAVSYDPKFALAYAALAHVLAMEDRFWNGNRADDAMHAAEKAISLDADLYQGYHAYGDIQANAENFESALRAYNLALDLNSKHASTTYEIANVYFKQRKYAKAKEYYLRTIEYESNFHPAMSQLGYLYLNAGDIPEAKRWLDKALDDVPLQVQAVLGLASIDLVMGRHISAVSRCNKVNEVFPTNYNCLQTSAVASLLHGDLPAARSMFRKMAEIWPDDGYALLGEAQILMAEAETEKANSLINDVLKRYKDRVASNDNCTAENAGCWRESWIIAASYALKNDPENAYLWLDRTASAGRRDHLWDASDPVFSALRNDAKFDEYIATTKFDYW